MYAVHWVGMCWFEAHNTNMCSIFQTKVNCVYNKCFWICKIIQTLFLYSIASLIHMRRFYTFILHLSVVTRKITHVSILSRPIADLQTQGCLNYLLFVDSVVISIHKKFAIRCFPSKTINVTEFEECLNIVKNKLRYFSIDTI